LILLSVGSSRGALEVPSVAREIATVGHRVEVILEPDTRQFVGSAAFPAPVTLVDVPSEAPEAVLFAPATAATIARLARGLGDGPAGDAARMHRTFVVPDLDAGTAVNAAVRENLAILVKDGFGVIRGGGSAMVEAEEVVAGLLGGLGGPMSGMRLLVTAGGTREPIDSVRFIGNRSSGKMGLAIAREAVRQGAQVTVVAANLGRSEPGTKTRPVETVAELGAEVLVHAGDSDALVMAAAVSDFTPASPLAEKIRRGQGTTAIELKPTTDILKAVREQNSDLFVVGFAATHGNPVPDAREKLVTKGADIMIGNDISLEGVGFDAEENEVYVVGRAEAGVRLVPRTCKREVARVILASLLTGMSEERRG
jgi:phosphopantothenoylcysteine decarboxylase / phosphopantothenate---cysteine ligase